MATGTRGALGRAQEPADPPQAPAPVSPASLPPTRGPKTGGEETEHTSKAYLVDAGEAIAYNPY